MSPRGLSCAQAEELASELALGTLDGEERAAVLSHVAACASCRELADRLAGVADGLLILAPPAEPPAGFESRVLERIDTHSAAQPPSPLTRGPLRSGHAGRPLRSGHAGRPLRSGHASRPGRGLLGVAAVALVAALAGAGLALLAGPERAAGNVHTALAEDDKGRWTCRAVAYGSDPAWLFVALDRRDGANRSFTVEARRVGDAAPISLGKLTLHDGHGSLATLLQVPAPELHSIRMLDETGEVRYEAEFRPSS
ncbi:MAG TPA: zf-HC2 domain-containing protein [Acidimicrobiales bacterium]|nr:zf-HC2 domain-containing protein [Acidimicrobiales bacterium]